MTLVGESGGLSSVYETGPSNVAPGLILVTTEHGPLYLDPDEHYPVLSLDDQTEPDPREANPSRLYLLVNNTDVSGTGLVVVFRDEAHFAAWFDDTNRIAANPEQPFAFRGEWGTTPRLLTPAEATALVVRHDSADDSPSDPETPEESRG